MKFFTFLIPVFFIACSAPAETQQVVSEISAQELHELISEKEILLIDLRTPEEISLGMIDQAIHLDFYDAAFEEKIGQLDKSKPVVLYCASGMRSARASGIFERHQFEHVHDLTGGIRSWQVAGYNISIPDEN